MILLFRFSEGVFFPLLLYDHVILSFGLVIFQFRGPRWFCFPQDRTNPFLCWEHRAVTGYPQCGQGLMEVMMGCSISKAQEGSECKSLSHITVLFGSLHLNI